MLFFPSKYIKQNLASNMALLLIKTTELFFSLNSKMYCKTVILQQPPYKPTQQAL